MKRIEINNGDVWATNNDGTGCFQRNINSGAYQQRVGNGQTPIFKSRKQFRDYIRRQFDVRGRIIADYGW